MIKSEIEKVIKRFLAGDLSLEEEKILLDWIKSSPRNENFFFRYQQEVGVNLRLYNKDVEQHLQQVLSRIHQSDNSRIQVPTRLRKIIRYSIPIAAAFIAGIVLSIQILFKKSETFHSITEQRIVVPHGARTQFLLPDSSFVWLNAGSEITYPNQFGESRSVQLSGEAYFEVRKTGTPFIVSTNYGNVEVKGTTFDVKAYNDELFETTLVTGKVLVNTDNQESVILSAGEQAFVEGDVLLVQAVETELFTSWTEGKLIFRDEYLPQLTRKLERWYNIQIELGDDPRLAEINYSGTIEMESFSEVLNLLSVTAPVGYTWNPKARLIKIFYKEK